MTLRAPLLAALVAALVLVLPVQGWAQGVMARVTTLVVICTDHGADTVLLDFRGDRVDLLPGCPDCAPSAVGPVGWPRGLAVAVSLGGGTLWSGGPSAPALSALAPGRFWPRAPPV